MLRVAGLFLIILLLVGCKEESSTASDINLSSRSNFRYITDQEKHHVADYWQTAEETQKDKSGDCEDFAIYQAALLLKQGVPAKDMQFVLYINIYTGTQHLILEYDDYLMDLTGIYPYESIFINKYIEKDKYPIYNQKSPKSYFKL